MQIPLIIVGTPTFPAENHCACPDIIASLPQRPPGATSNFKLASSLYRAPLPDDHEVVCAPLAGSPVLVLNPTARMILDRFRHLGPINSQQPSDDIDDEIARAVTQRLAMHQLLVPLDENVTYEPQPTTTLTVWLHITEACNLRCSYCYVAKSSEMMSEDIGRQAIDTAVRTALQHGFRAIKLKYAGGEASLNTKLIQILHAYAVEMTRSHGLDLYEAVLSNGVFLSPTFLAFIRDTNMGLMISLDGVGAVHDEQRMFINGRGSFQHIEQTIDRVVELGIKPDISVTVTGRNAHHLSNVVRFMLDRNLRFNLNFYRENDRSAHLVDLLNDNQQLINGLRAAFDVIETRVPSFRLIDGLIDRSSFNAPHGHACSAGIANMAITPHGQISRCQMELEEHVTNIWSQNPLHTIRLEPSGFRNVSVDEKDGCRTCDWRYWCGGGCSLLTYRSSGRNDVKSPYCDVYKAVYPDVIRLEGLRLLQWGATHGVQRDVFERWV